MKIVICSVPQRSEDLKTVYPPLGALAVIQSLISAGYDAHFYDINVFRPSSKEIEKFFLEEKCDVVGISATISTSYGFVKYISKIIKFVSPQTVIVIGGALTASSEILLKFTDADYCVVGEGEKVIVNLVNYVSTCGVKKFEEELKKIRGICFLDSKDKVIFTGYEDQLPAEKIQYADYKIIQRYSKLDCYIIDPFFYEQFKYDKRSFEEKRVGKKIATVVTSRGCVNRCSFCHRWQKGIRIFTVDKVIGYVQHLMDEYDVGFISFGDEDFGAAKRWLEEFIEKIKSLDILYRISGICADNVNPSVLKRLKESGCVSVHYGFESGSDKILKVMEKRADVATNIKVATWTHEAELQTVYAMVVGMPGESYKTIRETTNFVNRINEFSQRLPILSINALVALPGAPVYEYARCIGLLGKTLEEEEGYLLRVSDTGGDSLKQLNLTDYPYFIVHGWIRCIYWARDYNYYLKNKIPLLTTRKLIVRLFQFVFNRKKTRGGFSGNFSSYPLFYYLRYFISPILVMHKNFKEDKGLFFQRCFELLIWPFKRKKFENYISLRDFLKDETKDINPESVQILRLGR